MIFMIADANVVANGFVTGSMAAKVHMPQHAMMYVSDPLNPTCFPAEYPLM
jgi:hypothetical protein